MHRILYALLLSLCLSSHVLAGSFEDAASVYKRDDYTTLLKLWHHLAEQGVANPDDHTSRSKLPLALESLKDTHRIELVNELRINLDPSALLVVPDKCQKAGEIELKRLAISAKFEEAYVFVPFWCTWIEVGLDEGLRTVQFDLRVLEKLLSSITRAVLYHVHTGAGRDSAGYFPAYKDLIATIILGSEFSKFHNQIIHRAVSPLGVFEYKFVPTQETYRLKNLMDQTGLGPYASQNLAYIYATSVHREKYYSVVRDCIQVTKLDTYRLDECFPMFLENFVILYQSYAGKP